MVTDYRSFFEQRNRQALGGRQDSGGDEDWLARFTDSQAHVPGSYASMRLDEARIKAQRALDRFGASFDPQQFETVSQIAESGTVTRNPWYQKLLGTIDAPVELVRLGVAKLSGADRRAGVNITGQDFLDSLLSREASVRQRLGGLAGEGEYVAPVADQLEALGVENKAARAILGFTGEVLLDPTTYISFGTIGLGKKVASEAAQVAGVRAARNAAERIAQRVGDDGLEAFERRIFQRMTEKADEMAPLVQEELVKRARRELGDGWGDDMVEEFAEQARELALDAEVWSAKVAVGEQADKLDEVIEALRKGGRYSFASDEIVGDVVSQVASKRFGTLEDRYRDFIEYSQTPAYATGGLKIVPPWFRKQMPLLDLGLRNDFSIRGTLDRIVARTPGPARDVLDAVVRRASFESSELALAARGGAWKAKVSANISRQALEALHVDAGVATELSSTLRNLRKAADGAGADWEQINQTVVRALTEPKLSVDSVLRSVPEAVRGAMGETYATIRSTLDAFHTAAREAGMDIGKIDHGYFPLVASPEFRSTVRRLAEAGVSLDPEAVEGNLQKMGYMLLSEYASSAGAAVSRGARDPGASRFALERTVNRVVFSGAADMPDLSLTDVGGNFWRGLVSVSESGYLSHGEMNRAIKAALEDLVQKGKLSSREAGKIAPFSEDLGHVLDTYVGSMSRAINFRTYVREATALGLMEPAVRKISKGRTLAALEGRLGQGGLSLLEDVVLFGQRLGEHQRHLALESTVVKVGSHWTLDVPSVVAEDPRFVRAMDRLRKRLETAKDFHRDTAYKTRLAAQRYADQGLPKDLAERLAAATGDSEVRAVVGEVMEIADQKASAVMESLYEMLGEAQNRLPLQQQQKMIERALRYADSIRAGASKTVREMHSQWNKTFRWTEAIVERPYLFNLAGNALDGTPWLRLVGEELSRVVRVAQGDKAIEAMKKVATQAKETLAAFARTRNLRVSDLLHHAANEASDATWAGRILDRLGIREGNKVGDLVWHVTTPEAAAGIRAEGLARGGLHASREAAEAAYGRGGEFVAIPFARADLPPNVLAKLDRDGIVEDVAHVRGPKPKPTTAVTDDDPFLADYIERLPVTSMGDLDDQDMMELWHFLVRGKSKDETGIVAMYRFNKMQDEMLRGTDADHILRDKIIPNLLRGGEDAERVIRNHRQAFLDGMARLGFDPNAFDFRSAQEILYGPRVVDITTKRVWLDDVLEEVKNLVPDPGLTRKQRLERLHAMTPDQLEGISDNLKNYLRLVGRKGSLPFDMDAYENLQDFLDQVAKAKVGLRRDARVTEKAIQGFADLEKHLGRTLKRLREVADGGTAGRLLSGWEESKPILRKLLPHQEFGQLTDAVEFVSVARKATPPARALMERNLKMTREMWRPLDETYEQVLALSEELADDLATAASAEALQAVADVNAFREAWAALMRDQAKGWRNDAYLTVADELGGKQIGEAVGLAHRAGKALRTLGAEAASERPAFLPWLTEEVEGLRDVRRTLNKLAEGMEEWKPKKAALQVREGYVAPQVGGIAGEAVRGLVADRDFALILENMAGALSAISTPAGIRMIGESARGLTTWWKAAATVGRPTFVPRNLMGGIVNGMLIGVGPKQYSFVGDNILKWRRMIANGSTPDAALRALPGEFQPYMEGLLRSGMLNTSFSTDLAHVTADVGNLSFNPLNSRDFLLFRAGGKVMQTSEDFMRAAAFVRHYDPTRPETLELAKSLALAVHFDYQDLTRIERSIKRFVPFFVWTRRNLPLQVRMMLERPGVVSKWQHLVTNFNAAMNGVEQDEYPTSSYGSVLTLKTDIVFNEETPFWSRLMFDPQIPLRDVEQAMGAWEQGGPINFLASVLHPGISTTMNIAASQEYPNVNAPTGLREILHVLDWLTPGRQNLGSTQSGDQRIPYGTRTLANTAVPFAQEWLNLAGVQPSDPRQQARLGYTEEEPDLGDRLRAAALTFGRAFGATTQTPGDTLGPAAEARSYVDELLRALEMQGAIQRER